MPYHLIQNQTSFNNVLPEISNQPEIALDLEFDRNSFGYGFVMCLIQIATQNEVWLIDPLKISNLSGLWKILENEAITKVIHNASEDVLLFKRYGCRLKNIWDTEKAAMILNHQKTGLSSILEDYFEVSHSKKQQRTNWRARPLSAEQLDYAVDDVRYLLDLKDKLKQGLERAGRLDWIYEEGKEIEALEEKEKPFPFLKYKDAGKLKPDQLGRLERFYELRENWAKSEDRPPFQILSNQLLVEFSREEIPSLGQWKNLKGLNPKFRSADRFNEYENRVKNAGKSNNSFFKRERQKKDNRLDENLKEIRKELQKDFGEQSAKLILSQSVMNDLQNDREMERLKPYARKIIREYADNLGLKL